MFQRNKAFTLMELLVVMAIIGILSSVVLTNLNGSRAKARDSKRIADIQQLRLVLELYFDNNREYPDALADLIPTYTSVVPVDPSTGTSYPYDNYSDSSRTTCTIASSSCVYYHLGAKLEGANSVLVEDVDLNGKVGNGPDGLSVGVACATDASATTVTDLCYDVTS